MYTLLCKCILEPARYLTSLNRFSFLLVKRFSFSEFQQEEAKESFSWTPERLQINGVNTFLMWGA